MRAWIHVDRERETDIDLNVYVCICLYVSITFLASHCHFETIFLIYYPQTPTQAYSIRL